MQELERRLGYRFQNKAFLENALTHSSFANENRHEKRESNERLEFLGDSILGFVVAAHLYAHNPDRHEGELTRMRADLVCEKSLAKVAHALDLGNFLLLGHGEEQSGGRSRDSILADAVESVLAAAYLDGGFAAASGIIHRLLLQQTTQEKPRNFDYKTALQELVQRQKDQVLHYRLLNETGPDHDKTFLVDVSLNGKVVGQGSGTSKKRAEQAAACEAIQTLFPNEL